MKSKELYIFLRLYFGILGLHCYIPPFLEEMSETVHV